MSADLALQKALVAAIKADVAGVSSRIHDRPPQSVAFPWVHVDLGQIVPEDTECLDGLEIFFDLRVWSRKEGAGTVQARQIAEAIRLALAARIAAGTLTLDEPYALVDLTHRQTIFRTDPDGLTVQAILSFEAMVEA